MADRELIRLPTPYKFTLDGTTMLKGVSADFTHENFNGMDFFDFGHLGLSNNSDDYVWIGINYEQAILVPPNAQEFVGSGLDDMFTTGTYTGTENQAIVINVSDAAASPETYSVSLDDGATFIGDDVTLYCSSDNAADTAVTISVTGLDGSLAFQTATQVLNGQTKTAIGSGETWRQITSVTVTVGTAVGNIYTYADDTVTAGVPDTLAKWRIVLAIGMTRNARILFSDGIDMSTSPVAIPGGNGLQVDFGATTGHTGGDKWLVWTLGTAHYGEDILKSWEVA